MSAYFCIRTPRSAQRILSGLTMPATYLPLNKIQYLSPRMDRIMKILTAIIVLGLAGVACAHRHCGAPAPSAGAAVTLPVRPDSGEVVMRSFAGTLPAEALCTLTVYMQRHSGDGVLHRHPRPRQRAECGKRQIIYAARPRRFDDMAVRLRRRAADILFSCRRPARPHIPHTRRIRHRPPLPAGIDTVSVYI